MREISTPALALILATSSVAAQDGITETHRAALNAGHQSMFTCSAVFNAGRKAADIARGELAPRFLAAYFGDTQVAPAAIDQRAKTVATAYLDSMPPRLSVWRPYLGCAALPIGAGPEAAASVPRIDLPVADMDWRPVDWPQGDRTQTRPVPAGLAQVVSLAFDGTTFGQDTATTAVLVIRDGQIVAERYREDFDLYTSQRTWSVAKSMAATLIGIAVGQGLLELDAPVPIPEWQAPGDPRSKITMANLLHMSSGLYSGPAGNRTDFIYFGGGTVTEHAVKHPLEAAPGSRWKYANNDTMLAMRALRAALQDDTAYLTFPFLELLHPIGMWHTVPETDWEGNFILSSQVWTTARDLGRLGLLYLNDGVWNGHRLLPEGWAEYVRTPAPNQPPPRGQGPRRGYGAQFWLYPDAPGLPPDTHAMLGNRGQIVVLVPSRNAVVVRRGFDDSGAGVRFDAPGFAAAVLAAMADSE